MRTTEEAAPETSRDRCLRTTVEGPPVGLIRELDKAIKNRGAAFGISVITYAAELLQVVRRVQGDVHSTKLADNSLAYDAIKLCSVMFGLLRPYL